MIFANKRCEYVKRSLQCRNWATGRTGLCPAHRSIATGAKGAIGVALNPQEACAYLAAWFAVIA